jgi:hypothetical protein
MWFGIPLIVYSGVDVMATSGSGDFSTSTTQIISDAFAMAGLFSIDESIPAVDYEYAARILNAMVKNWSGPSGRPLSSKKMWTRKRAVLFLQQGQSIYELGPSGDTAADVSYLDTTLALDVKALDVDMPLISTSGAKDGDTIKVWMDDGTIHVTTVNGTPTAYIATIATGIPADTSLGNRVIAFTNLSIRPVEILSAVLRDADNNDSSLSVMDFNNYEQMPRKDSPGDPSSYFYEPQLVNGKIYFDFAPNDVTKVVDLVYRAPIYDFDAVSDEPDMPQEWYEPLVSNFAIRLCTSYGRKLPEALGAIAASSLSIAQTFEPETCTDYFEPGRD